MKPEDYLKDGKVFVWHNTYAVLKSRRPYPDAFANIQDKKELTVIIKEDKVNERDVIAIETGWRLLTFDMTLPFDLVGFLAKITKELAEEGISIFAISSYSTDHILIKDKHLKKAEDKLKSLGLKVYEK